MCWGEGEAPGKPPPSGVEPCFLLTGTPGSSYNELLAAPQNILHHPGGNMQSLLPGNASTCRCLESPLRYWAFQPLLGTLTTPSFMCQEFLVYISIRAHTVWMYLWAICVLTPVFESLGGKNGDLYPSVSCPTQLASTETSSCASHSVKLWLIMWLKVIKYSWQKVTESLL